MAPFIRKIQFWDGMSPDVPSNPLDSDGVLARGIVLLGTDMVAASTAPDPQLVRSLIYFAPRNPTDC